MNSTLCKLGAQFYWVPLSVQDYFLKIFFHSQLDLFIR
jgi:hypothetical protein